MDEERLRSERSLALFALAFIALNFPILSLFDRGAVFFGVPAFYLYLFASWAMLILLTFASLRKRDVDPGDPGSGEEKPPGGGA